MNDEGRLLNADFEMNGLVMSQVHCDNPTHLHHAEVQNLIGFETNGHWVDVTQDGDVFHVRIDENNETVQSDLSSEEALLYVHLMTGGV